MAELVSNLRMVGEPPTHMERFMALYCWPCRTVHEFPLADVERIVYTLALAVENASYTLDPLCPLDVLSAAVSGPHRQAVELCVGRREEADEWGTEQQKCLDGLDQQLQQRDAAVEAVLAIHRPCHTPATEPWGCQWGHGQDDTGIPGPDQPATCITCTYDDRTVAYPCATAQALGVSA